MRVAFIGFGEAARAFVDSLAATAPSITFAAFDLRQDDEMAKAMSSRDVRMGADPCAAIEGADWVFSAVTADQSFLAAKSVEAGLAAGQVFFDINSVSPERKRKTAALVVAQGADYIDMAVMAPVHPKGHATPVLTAGRRAAEMNKALAELGFSSEAVGVEPGEATAIKMVRSLFVKGLEAITVEALLAASASGCFERVYASLSKSFPGLGWPEHAAYAFERTLKHGNRRAAEMRESAVTLDGLGLQGGLADRIADVQEAMGALEVSDLEGGDLAGAVSLVARRRTKG